MAVFDDGVKEDAGGGREGGTWRDERGDGGSAAIGRAGGAVGVIGTWGIRSHGEELEGVFEVLYQPWKEVCALALVSCVVRIQVLEVM